MLPDPLRGEELRSVLWDDETGTVDGDHSEVPYVRQVFEAPKPVTVGDPGQVWHLDDPARNPQEFLVVLWNVHPPVLGEPLRSTLPSIFEGIGLPPGEKDEALYDGEGREIV